MNFNDNNSLKSLNSLSTNSSSTNSSSTNSLSTNNESQQNEFEKNKIQCSLNLIIGPMFSGKTTELLRVAKRLKSINNKVLLLNYSEDTRYSNTAMVTHDNEGLPCEFVNNLTKISIDTICEYDVICINEGQFFANLVKFCMQCLKMNKSVYVCGLDGDFKQEKFGEILDLIPKCDTIIKLHSYCSICKNGTFAPFTKRITNSNEQKLIGTNEYIPVCRRHL